MGSMKLRQPPESFPKGAKTRPDDRSYNLKQNKMKQSNHSVSKTEPSDYNILFFSLLASSMYMRCMR